LVVFIDAHLIQVQPLENAGRRLPKGFLLKVHRRYRGVMDAAHVLGVDFPVEA
jgi:hypothetical protein